MLKLLSLYLLNTLLTKSVDKILDNKTKILSVNSFKFEEIKSCKKLVN